MKSIKFGRTRPSARRRTARLVLEFRFVLVDNAAHQRAGLPSGARQRLPLFRGIGAGPRATDAYEPRQIRKEAAISKAGCVAGFPAFRLAGNTADAAPNFPRPPNLDLYRLTASRGCPRRVTASTAGDQTSARKVRFNRFDQLARRSPATFGGSLPGRTPNGRKSAPVAT